MNGNSTGVTPVVELATNNGNGFYPYPVMYGNNGGFGNGGFFGGEGIWAILLFAMIFGNGGWGNNGGGFFGGRGFDDGYAWLSNGQKEIMQNTNNGFDTLHLSNQLDTVNSGIYSLSNQLCNTGNNITNAINTTAYNAEIAAANRQMANMNTAFDLSRQFADCCCENRLGIANLNATILSENCADRYASAQNTRDIIENANRNNQAILDKLCQLELDGFKRENDQLRSQLQFANMQASQVQQTADLKSNNAIVANQLVSELRSCPIPSQPVYGNQPIFTCNGNNGCGCGNNAFYATI